MESTQENPIEQDQAERELNELDWIRTDLLQLLPAAGLERGEAYRQAVVAVSAYARTLSPEKAQQYIQAAYPSTISSVLLNEGPPPRQNLVLLIFGAVISQLDTGEYDQQKPPPTPPTQEALDLLWGALSNASVPMQSPAVFAVHVLTCAFETHGQDLTDEQLGDAFESLLRAFFPDQARRLADKPMSVGAWEELRESLQRARHQVEKNLGGEEPAARENILASFDNVDQVIGFELEHARADAGFTSAPHEA